MFFPFGSLQHHFAIFFIMYFYYFITGIFVIKLFAPKMQRHLGIPNMIPDVPNMSASRRGVGTHGALTQRIVVI